MQLNDTIPNALAAALASGILLLLSRDIGPFGPLVLVAPVPVLLYALSSDRIGRVFLVAAFARLFGCAALVYTYAGALPPIVLATISALLALEFAVIVLLTRLSVQRLPAWAATLSFPLLVTAAEFLLQFTSSNGSFGALAYSLIDIGFLVQIASVGGVAAVTFVAALVSMTIVLLLFAPTRRRQVLAASLAPLIAVSVFGIWRLSLPYDDRVRIALASIDSLILHSLQGPAEAAHVVSSYVDLLRALPQQDLEAIVLPERVFADHPTNSPDASAQFQTLSNTLGAQVIAGFHEARRDDRPRNTARLFAPDAQPQTYAKRKMIPGLEAEFAPGVESFVTNDRGIAICKDLDFAPMIREYGQGGANLVFVPAWDFKLDGRLHARMAVMRGIENGFALARAAANGRLTLADAFGRIAAEATTSDEEPVVLVGEVGLRSERTVYSRFGDVFAWLSVAATAMLLVWLTAAGRLSSRARSREPRPLRELS